MTKQNIKSKKFAKRAELPRSEDAFMKAFDAAYEKKQYKKAADLAAVASTAFPDNWHILYLYAEALYNDGHQRWETPHIETLERIERICDLLIAAGEGKTEGLQVAPPQQDIGPYVLRAFALQGKGDRHLLIKKDVDAHAYFLDAERQFMDTLEIWPNDLPALTGYALTLQKLGTADKADGENFVLAKDCFRRAIGLDTERGQAYVTCTAGYAMLLMRNE